MWSLVAKLVIGTTVTLRRLVHYAEIGDGHRVGSQPCATHLANWSARTTSLVALMSRASDFRAGGLYRSSRAGGMRATHTVCQQSARQPAATDWAADPPADVFECPNGQLAAS